MPPLIPLKIVPTKNNSRAAGQKEKAALSLDKTASCAIIKIKRGTVSRRLALNDSYKK
jgi:hypothetical protein